MTLRYNWFISAFVLGLLVQPGAFVGCSSDAGGDYDFGKAEVLDVIDSANETGTWYFESVAQQYTISVHIADASSDAPPDEKSRLQSLRLLLKRARACGTHVRTFSAIAAACDDEYQTELPVTGTARVYRREGDADSLVYERPLEGIVEVFGLSLRNAVNVRIYLRGEPLEVVLVRTSPLDEFQLDKFLDPSIGVSVPVGGHSEPG